ncbi:hypothetical protein HDV05_008808 [Chytridiales sp. JEL 0842]|nr:hypothetical protein HDV05_008808 [Chytridiales sp. JEL 0842]
MLTSNTVSDALASASTTSPSIIRRPRKSLARPDRKFDLSKFSSASIKQKQQQEQQQQGQVQQIQQSVESKDAEPTDDAMTMDDLINTPISDAEVSPFISNESANSSNNATMTTSSSTTASAAVATATLSPEEAARAHQEFLRRQKDISNELLAEHFGFVPTEFIDDVINAMNELVYQAMEEFQAFVENEGGDELEVEKGMTSLETLLENAVDKNFDKFEIFVLNNIFAMPSHLSVTLPHYKDVDETVNPADEDFLDAELEHLRKRFVAAKIVNERLKSDLSVLDTHLPQILSLKQSLSTIHPSHPSIQEARETLAEIKTQLERLRQVSGSVNRRTRSKAFQKVLKRTENRNRHLNSVLGKYLDRQKGVLGGAGKKAGMVVGEGMMLASEEELREVERTGLVPKSLAEINFAETAAALPM